MFKKTFTYLFFAGSLALVGQLTGQTVQAENFENPQEPPHFISDHYTHNLDSLLRKLQEEHRLSTIERYPLNYQTTCHSYKINSRGQAIPFPQNQFELDHLDLLYYHWSRTHTVGNTFLENYKTICWTNPVKITHLDALMPGEMQETRTQDQLLFSSAHQHYDDSYENLEETAFHKEEEIDEDVLYRITIEICEKMNPIDGCGRIGIDENSMRFWGDDSPIWYDGSQRNYDLFRWYNSNHTSYDLSRRYDNNQSRDYDYSPQWHEDDTSTNYRPTTKGMQVDPVDTPPIPLPF